MGMGSAGGNKAEVAEAAKQAKLLTWAYETAMAKGMPQAAMMKAKADQAVAALEARKQECIHRNLPAEQYLTRRKCHVFLCGLNCFQWMAQLPNKFAVAPCCMVYLIIRLQVVLRSKIAGRTLFSLCPQSAIGLLQT